MPSCPKRFDPQQYNCPSVPSPQLCRSPAVTRLNDTPPRTSAGTLLLVPTTPLPSSPMVLRPQQYASPLIVTPQVCLSPAATVTNFKRPETGTGVAAQAFPLKAP